MRTNKYPLHNLCLRAELCSILYLVLIFWLCINQFTSKENKFGDHTLPCLTLVLISSGSVSLMGIISLIHHFSLVISQWIFCPQLFYVSSLKQIFCKIFWKITGRIFTPALIVSVPTSSNPHDLPFFEFTDSFYGFVYRDLSSVNF